jgi:hypothetical protein
MKLRFDETDRLPLPQGWYIVIQTKNKDFVESNVKLGTPIGPEHVRSWFAREAKNWPTPLNGSSLNRFVLALNVMRVTVTHTIDGTRDRHIADGAPDLEKIKATIGFLADQMPALADKARNSMRSSLTPLDILILEHLADSLIAAKEVFFNIGKQSHEVAWHQDARLIEWHIRKLLEEAGYSEHVGYAADSRIARVVVAALAAIGVAASHSAVAAALKRFSTQNSTPPTASQLHAGPEYSVVA